MNWIPRGGYTPERRAKGKGFKHSRVDVLAPASPGVVIIDDVSAQHDEVGLDLSNRRAGTTTVRVSVVVNPRWNTAEAKAQ
eukprot:2500063-Pyramimonas_sp.AAC.1